MSDIEMGAPGGAEPSAAWGTFAWSPGDRVEIDSEGHPWRGELGYVIGLDDTDGYGMWMVRLDDGEEVGVYGYELNGVVGPSGEVVT